MNRLAGTAEGSAGRSRWFAAIALCGLCVGVARGQVGGGDPLAPLRGGTLVVWIVSSENDPNPLPKASLAATAPGPPQFQEQTAGSFGQTAGSVGQTAGSTGQTMGNFGQTAGSVGQTAGSTGQTAGSFGKGIASRNAGDAGKTMANFGVSTSDLAKASATANAALTAGHTPVRYGSWDVFVDKVQKQFPELQATFVAVYGNDLQALLETVAGTADTPDILLGTPLPWEWTRPESGLAVKYGIGTLWSALRVAQIEDLVARADRLNWEAAIVASARNPQAAMAFAVWFSDIGAVGPGYGPGLGAAPKPGSPGAVAMSAVRGMLSGGSVGEADPDMARFNAAVMTGLLTGPRQGEPGPIDIRTDVTDLRVFDSLAVVAVRAIGLGQGGFGVAHALVVLRLGAARPDGSRRWRVLQISPNLTAASQLRAWSLLVEYCDGRALPGEQGSAALRNEGSQVLGVSQAAPTDGDTRPPQPELWWDNLGGGTLQVVEWQRSVGGWAGSNLFFVPDNNSRLRTRATARFASNPGQYRWRIWSVGKGGAVVLSPWRTMNIVPR